MIFCSLGFVFPVENIKLHQHSIPSAIMIGPIIDRNMRSLSIENLTKDSEYLYIIKYFYRIFMYTI